MKISRRKRRQRNVSAEKNLVVEGQNWQRRKGDEWTHLESLDDPVGPASHSLTRSLIVLQGNEM